MSYEVKVKAKDICEKILFIIFQKETKKYNLSSQTYIINLFKEVKTFEGNIKNVYGINGKYNNKISFKNITLDDKDIIKDDYYITFTFDNEEDLFYFQLKSNAEIFEVKEIK